MQIDDALLDVLTGHVSVLRIGCLAPLWFSEPAKTGMRSALKFYFFRLRKCSAAGGCESDTHPDDVFVAVDCCRVGTAQLPVVFL